MATCIMHYGIKNHRFKSVREGILAIFLTSMNFIFDTAQSQVFFWQLLKIHICSISSVVFRSNWELSRYITRLYCHKIRKTKNIKIRKWLQYFFWINESKVNGKWKRSLEKPGIRYIQWKAPKWINFKSMYEIVFILAVCQIPKWILNSSTIFYD